MEFFRRAPGIPGVLGILPGTFNPPTRAHLCLAEAGLAIVDEVLIVLPRTLPHRNYDGVAFESRLRMLEAAVGGRPKCSIAATPAGLFVEIARECREAYGPGVALTFLCGRDAAERFVTWDYGSPDAALEHLREFNLLVAARQGAFSIPSEMQHAIRLLPAPADCDDVSATRVREAAGEDRPWEHWVPEEVAPLVRRFYGKRFSS